ncbi:MAG: pirin family protein [Deltaproteobacteria bacterium]|nr:pirin family protein [Deltaproteobacteria bacterium]
MTDKFKVLRLAKGVHVVDGAGVKINRIIGTNALSHIDPFVLLDEIRSSKPDDYVAGFPTHPHRGIETITYMIHGSFRHKDSRGGGGLLTDGCVQWMTAGKGILHSEMPEETKGELWGYQLWLNLAAKDKMTEPGYQHISPDMIPAVEKDGVVVKVISGKYGNATGPAKNILSADYFDVSLDKNAAMEIKIRKGMSCFIYVHTGEVLVRSGKEEDIVSEKTLAELPAGFDVEFTSNGKKAGFLYFAASPNNEPIARGGPFVMNTRDEIRQAFEDYESGLIG